jgi:hypothetical protein
MADPSPPERRRRRPARWIVAGAVLVAGLAAAGLVLTFGTTATSHTRTTNPPGTASPLSRSSTARAPARSTTTTLPPAGPGFVPGSVTAIGDSVMLDYQDPLQFALPGADIEAAVSRQWSEGETMLNSLKSEGRLGAEVVVALGTNGPITDADIDSMMSILSGASRVVFVNVHVDRAWQDPNNAVLARGATRYPRIVLADWASLAAQNPQWFGSDGTHLPIDGPGAAALALLVATTLTKG